MNLLVVIVGAVLLFLVALAMAWSKVIGSYIEPKDKDEEEEPDDPDDVRQDDIDPGEQEK